MPTTKKNVLRWQGNVRIVVKAPQLLDRHDVQLAEPELLLPDGGGSESGPLLEGEFIVLTPNGWKRLPAENAETFVGPNTALALVIGGARRVDTMVLGKATAYTLKPGDVFETRVYCLVTGDTLQVGTALTVGPISAVCPSGKDVEMFDNTGGFTNVYKCGLRVKPADASGAKTVAVVEEILANDFIRCRAV